MPARKTFRVEYHHANSGWTLRRPEWVGLTARTANRRAEEEREFERYYAALGARPARIRVVCEQTGHALWLA